MCDGVADFDVPDTLDSGNDITDFSCDELIPGGRGHLVVAQFLHRVVTSGVHEVNRVASRQRSIHDTALENHTSIRVEMGVEDQRFQRRVRVSGWARQILDYAGKDVFNSLSRLRGDRDRLKGIESQVGIDLLSSPVNICGREIDFVDHRQELEVVLHGQVEIGDRLGLDPLGGIHNDQSTVAGHQRTSHFVGKVDVPGRVDQVQLVVVPVRGMIGERDRVALDGDAPFTFDVHLVQQLISEFSLRDTAAGLDEPIGQRGFAVIDVGDDAEVSDEFHENASCSQGATSTRGRPEMMGGFERQERGARSRTGRGFLFTRRIATE